MKFIEEFFDVRNYNHLDAYNFLKKNGNWPNGFLPNDIEIEPNWNYLLISKMAGAWVEHMAVIRPLLLNKWLT